MISITLTQANITSTIHFTVQYRGANLAPPELSYTGTYVFALLKCVLIIMIGDNVTYVEDDDYVLIFNGTVNITDDDHSSYVTSCYTLYEEQLCIYSYGVTVYSCKLVSPKFYCLWHKILSGTSLLYCHRYLLQSATVEIIEYYSQDQLSVMMNSTLNYTFTNGVLTITQPASVENYQETINNIAYSHTDEEPLSGVRTIRVNVTDSPLFGTDLITTTLNADIL